jgi:hypothetical protein
VCGSRVPCVCVGGGGEGGRNTRSRVCCGEGVGQRERMGDGGTGERDLSRPPTHCQPLSEEARASASSSCIVYSRTERVRVSLAP